MADSASGLYVDGVLSHKSWSPSFTAGRKRPRSNRSVFNSTDNWDELVAASSLSTASVSTRPARPRGLQSLTVCAEHAAVRHFKRLYEEGKIRHEGGRVEKGWWENEWEVVPDHLKLKVREGVYRRYGSMLKQDVIRDLFIIPPELDYPGHLIPALASAASLKPLHPPSDTARQITSLSLRHCPQMTDAVVATLIEHLPNLELVNLKGCALVGSQTAKAILKRCPNIRGLNLKGTKISEADLTALLERYWDRLERLKVDNISSQNPDALFTSPSYPRLTHLCIPGDLINASDQHFRVRARQSGHTIAHPAPRPSRPNAVFDWPYFSTIFPALTHLYLPGLLIPPHTTIKLVPNRLVKLSLGFGGPPVPVLTLAELVASQSGSLRSVHIGHLLPDRYPAKDFEKLGEAFVECRDMQDFRFACDTGGSRDNKCDQAMQRFSDMLYEEALKGPWRSTLKHLHLSLPQRISAEAFSRDIADTSVPPLEDLSLPSADIKTSSDLSVKLSAYRNLRNLDLSGTSITTEEVYTILDKCLLLSRIDLTSCRGVGVRLRRGVFEAWEEDRAEKLREAQGEPEQGKRTRRRR